MWVFFKEETLRNAHNSDPFSWAPRARRKTGWRSMQTNTHLETQICKLPLNEGRVTWCEKQHAHPRPRLPCAEHLLWKLSASQARESSWGGFSGKAAEGTWPRLCFRLAGNGLKLLAGNPQPREPPFRLVAVLASQATRVTLQAARRP